MGRNARVAVIASVILSNGTSNSFPALVSTKTRTKKSKASKAQPRKLAMTAFRASEFDCGLDEAREPEPCGSTVCSDPVWGVSSIFRSREISRAFQVQSAPQGWPNHFIKARTLKWHTSSFFEVGAGEGNRTLIASLEGWHSTIELHPRHFPFIIMPALALSIHLRISSPQ